MDVGTAHIPVGEHSHESPALKFSEHAKLACRDDAKSGNGGSSRTLASVK
jgi:hypothetical protein